MREVETQVSWRDNRPRLLHVCAQDFTQSSVHQVCCSMVPASSVAFFDINFSRNYISNLQSSLLDFYLVHDQTLSGRIRIVNNSQLARWTNQHSDVANLSTTLRVERRAIQNNLAFFAFAQGIDFVTFDNG